MRTLPCLPPTHYRRWPVVLRGPHTCIPWIIAENTQTQITLINALADIHTQGHTGTKNPCTSCKYQTGTYWERIICQLMWTTHKLALLTQNRRRISYHTESTHWSKSSSLIFEAVRVLSKGTASKRNRRKVKTVMSNYLSPKAMAVKCYWGESARWTKTETVLSVTDTVNMTT